MRGGPTPPPLEGVRVLDFTRHMAGPYATQALSDYGADVIKVESLPVGDPSRVTGVDFIERDGASESALFLMWNRGKRSLAIDLRRPEGMEVVRRLVPGVDVVVENYRPGVADRIGLGYSELSELNERLVYCSISAFGGDGPLAAYPGTDPVVQAASGVMSVTGEPGGDPALVGVPVADFTGALLCVQGVLLALLARERTGVGQRVDVSMLYGLLSSLTTRLATYWTTGEDPARFGSAHSVVMPYEAFRTADGHAVAGVWGGNDGWEPFCAVIGRPDLAEDPRYRDNADRVRRRAELTPILAAVFAERTTSDWEARFREAGVLFSPVYSFSEILNHPQVTGAGLLREVEHPTLGTIPQLGPVIGLSETPGRIGAPPPTLGQHSAEILRQAGYDEGAIADLTERGVALEGA
jgi:crotonobetainyl-CoA:carnitine CoA-transferase CaiB-like acyl-CoA transferase